MKSKSTWISLMGVALVLAGILSIYELHRSGIIARKPLAITTDDLETYFQKSGTYRSVGPTSQIKQKNQFTYNPFGGTTDYAFVLGMEPGNGSEINFDIFVLHSTNNGYYPPLPEIQNVLNINGWQVDTLKLSFSVPVANAYFDNPYYNTQGLPGITHEIIAGKGVTLGSSWSTTIGSMSGWDDGNTLVTDLSKATGSEKELNMRIALMGDEAYVEFFIQPPLHKLDNDANLLEQWVDPIVSGVKNLGSQIEAIGDGELSEPYVFYMVSTAALVGIFDCGEVSADEEVFKTVVTGKSACALDTRRSSRKNSLASELGSAGVSTEMQTVVFEELSL
jgi:hypothetical protein